MTSVFHAETVGEIELDSKQYRLVREKGALLDYSTEYINEPPYESPYVFRSMVSSPQYSWHGGGFKSQAGIPDTSEYGRNTDARWPFRIIPSPRIHEIILPTSDTILDIHQMFEAGSYIWVFKGEKVFRIDPNTDVAVLSKDFGVTGVPMSGTVALDTSMPIFTSTGSPQIWLATAINPGGPDTYSGGTFTFNPYVVATGINRTFVVDSSGKLRNVSTGLSPVTEANYADTVQVGRNIFPLTAIPYGRSVIVGNSDGLWGVGEEGFGVPLFKRMIPDGANCKPAVLFDPWILISHIRGLYRWQPGLVQSCGIELETMNQSAIKGKLGGLAVEGDSIFAGITITGEGTYILVARDKKPGEQSLGPMIWDTLLYWNSASFSPASWGGAPYSAMVCSSLGAVPKLYFSYLQNGHTVGYIKLTDRGTVPSLDDPNYEPATSGSRTTCRYRFDNWGDKDFIKVSVVAKNVDANNYWTVHWFVDDGPDNFQDINLNAMVVNSPGLKTFFLPTTAKGREIQFRLDFVCDGTLVPEIAYFEPFAVPSPRKIPIIKCHLYLAGNAQYSYGLEARSAQDQYNDLEALFSVTAFDTSGPWGTVACSLRSLKQVQEIQEGNLQHETIVEVELQERVSV